MKHVQIGFLVVVSFFLLSCSDGGGSSSPSGDPDIGDAPTLTAADKSTIAPCPSQDLLTSAAERTAIKDAVLAGALSFLDVPFDIGDADNFKKKCGLEGFWDPANNVNEVPETILGGPVTLANLLTPSVGNAGICTTGSSPMTRLEGFPVAGTYRAEIKAANAGSTYHLRLRAVASGTSAGELFTVEPIVVPGDIETTLEYKVNGAVTAHADVATAVFDAIALSNDPVVFDASKSAGGPSVFNASIELICATKS